ncbi:MAG TPA: hypothetical protein VJA40_04325, partial [archaeon]|nr:hypothetical protein [archaeon]
MTQKKPGAREKLDSLALQRSIFYPAAEAYSDSPSGFYDYGPFGEAIRRKLVGFWRRELVQRENAIELRGSQV